MKKLPMSIVLVLIIATGLTGCMSAGRGHGPVESFVIPAAANPNLPQDLVATLNLGAEPKEVYLVVAPGADVHSLVAKLSLNTEGVITVVSSGTRVVQVNGVTPNDFSAPVLYSIEVPGEKEPWRYRVTVREIETNPSLAQLIVPAGSRLQPAFNPAVRAYRLEVPFASMSVRIQARAQSRFARSVSVDGKELPGPVGGADVDFSTVSEKPVTIEALAEDGATRLRYVVTVVRGAPDTNALLGSLDLQGVPFSPAFSPAQLGYQAVVPFETQNVIVRARPQSPVAGVTLAAAGGSAVPLMASGDPASPAGAIVALAQPAGLPLIVAVTAQDGSVQQYLMDIRRSAPDANSFLADLSIGIGGTGLALSPVFAPSRQAYLAVVPFSAGQVRVIAHPQSRVASLQLSSGLPGGRGGISVRGDPLSPDGAIVDVPPGADRFPLLVTVIAQNGTAASYVVELRRAAPERNSDLGSLSASVGVLSPSFSPRVLAYSLMLPPNADSVQFSAAAAGPGATVAIAGQPGPAARPGITFVLPVAPGGRAAVGINVRAEDGSQRQYVIQVARALPPAPAAPAQAAPAPVVQAPTPPVRRPPAPVAPAPAPIAQAPSQPVQQPQANPPAATGNDHVVVIAKNLLLGQREVAALAAGADQPGKTATITVRPYRSNEILRQETVPVDVRPQAGRTAVSLQYRSAGETLGRDRLIEIEVSIPTTAGRFLYYKEAMPAAGEADLTIPFFVYTPAPIPWPAIGSPVQADGYVSMVPPGKGERPEDKEAFPKNAKGEYGIGIEITDAATGKSLGKDTVWRKPGLARGQALRFAASVQVPEGGTVSCVLIATSANGRAWTATGQSPVWTTMLRYEGGFEPVLLSIPDELAPGPQDKSDKPDRGDKGDNGGGKDKKN